MASSSPRVRAADTDVRIASLAIRPWYGGLLSGILPNESINVSGPNMTPYDHYMPVTDDPRWRMWDKPIPEEWWFFFRQFFMLPTTPPEALPPRGKGVYFGDPLVLDRVSFIGAPRPKGGAVRHAFTPNGDCRRDLMRIRFRTTVSDRGTVQVIKPGGRVMITLDRDAFLKRYTFHTYYWDGRQRGGGIGLPGRYKLRVKLGDRVLVPPGVIRLHRSSKRVKSKC